MSKFTIQRLQTLFLLTSVFLLIFVPIRIGGSFIIGQALYYFILACIFFILILFSYMGVYSNIKISTTPIFISIGLTLWIAILSLFYSETVVPKDLFDVIRPIIYGLLFYVGYLNSNRENINKFIKFLLLLMIVQVVFSSTVFIDGFSAIQDIYKGRTSTDSVVKHYFRFSGTYGFPGAFGAIVSLFIAWYFLVVAFNPSFKNITIFLVFFIALILSGSRGAIIVLLPVIFLLTLKYQLFKLLLVLLSLLVVTFGILVFYLDIDLHAISYILELVEKGLSEGSLIYRLGELGLTYDLLEETLLLGVGPYNSYFLYEHGPIESLYLNYLGRYGVFGFFIVALVTLRVFTFTKKSKNNVMTLQNKYFMIAFSYWLFFSIFLGGISTSIIDQMKISALVFILIGSFYKVNREGITIITQQIFKMGKT
jgi:O-antigen ligase